MNNLYPKILNSLIKFLNEYHETKYSKRYWEIIIGPTLVQLLSVFWDRWELIKSASENYEIKNLPIIENHPKDNISQDFIGMPLLTDFIDTKESTAEQNYFATLFHEIGHSTGHESRLDRKFGNKFSNDDYAFEELVAELTAVFISGHTGLEPTPASNHASYIKSWNKRFKDDPRVIVKALKLAGNASQFFLDNTSLKIAKPEPAEKVKEPVKFETVALIKREELSA